VKRIGLLSLAGLGLGGLGLGGLLAAIPRFSSSSAPSATVRSLATPATAVLATNQTLQYQVHSLQHSVVYTLLIPAQSQFSVRPEIAPGVESLAAFANRTGAIAAVNGGFFDPVNQKSTSYVTVQGQQVGDPRQNERLVNNPDLSGYLAQILDRSEFRRYQCGQQVRYDITRHRTPAPAGCQLVDALGGGPQLLPQFTAQAEGFIDIANGTVIRDALGSQQPNARTAVGITDDGSIVLVMAAQIDDPASGMSLPELANFMKTLGAKKAMNLDGGSSSSLYYNGKTIHGKLDAQGVPVERSVKSVLLVQTEER
jgi:exopolysaccharide biosynthesis protein